MPASDVIVSVYAGPHDRRGCLVTVPWPHGRPHPALPAVSDDATGYQHPAQLGQADDGTVLLTWIEPDLAATATRAYRIVEGRPTSNGMRLVDAPRAALEVRVGDRLITAYHYAKELARPFLHPVVGPANRRLTRDVDVPAGPDDELDHPHHRSIWVAHGDVNGTDNWTDEPGHGRTVHQAFLLREGGPVYARFVALAHWVTAAGAPLLNEVRRVTVYRPLADERLLLDVDLTFTAAYGAVRFGATKEAGLLSVRVAPSMRGDRGGLIENAYGALTEAEAWGRPAQWCDYSSPATATDSASVGIAILDHPLNPRHPTHWHVRDYGLMAANPFGLAEFYNDPARDGALDLPAGASWRVRYRLVIHAGHAAQGGVRAAYLDYAHPPMAG